MSCKHVTGVNNLNAGLFIYSIEFHPIGLPVNLHLESCLDSDFAIQYINIFPSIICRDLIITNTFIHPRKLENAEHEKQTMNLCDVPL